MSPDLQDAPPYFTKQTPPPAAPVGGLPFTANPFKLYPEWIRVLPHEALENYVPGGFHPISLGDTLKDGRYTIRHKLGYGGQSTVWLAWDAHSEPGAWVSLKIKTADESAKGLDNDSEIRALKMLEAYYCSTERPQTQAQTQAQTRSFTWILDTFQHTGPNGVHSCIATEVLGPTLWQIVAEHRHYKDTLPPDMVLRLSRQLLQGLAFAHHAGIVHGDVSTRNISFTCKGAQRDGNDMLEMLGGEPETAAYSDEKSGPRPPGLPQHVVCCTRWENWNYGLVEDIRLIDWGWSFAKGQTVTNLGQPLDQRSPETFFEKSFTYKHDLWRAACVICEMFYQRSTFYCIGPDYFYVLRLVSKLGSLPDPWHAQWQEMMVGYRSAKKDVANMPREIIQDTFEPRRQKILAHILYDEYEDEDEDEYDNKNKKDKHKNGDEDKDEHKNEDKQGDGEEGDGDDDDNDDDEDKDGDGDGDEDADGDEDGDEDGDGDYYEYERDEYSEYDVEALKCLLWPIQGLLRYEPDKRISLQEAAASIEWTDHRRVVMDGENAV